MNFSGGRHSPVEHDPLAVRHTHHVAIDNGRSKMERFDTSFHHFVKRHMVANPLLDRFRHVEVIAENESRWQ